MSHKNPVYVGTLLHGFEDEPVGMEEWQKSAPETRGFYVIYDECSNQTKLGKASNLKHRAKNYVSYWPQGVLRYARSWTRVSAATKRIGRMYREHNDHVYGNTGVRGRDTDFESRVKAILGIKTEFMKGKPSRRLTRAIQHVEDTLRDRLKANSTKKEISKAVVNGRRDKALAAGGRQRDIMHERMYNLRSGTGR